MAVFALAVSVVILLPTVADAQSRERITAVDDGVRARLSHTTHPLIQSATDTGRLAPDQRLERMLLVLTSGDDMQQPLRTFLDSLQDKKSPNYHHWLTPDQFGARFGPAQADVDKITAWLEQQGFDHIQAARGRNAIEFSGSAQLVERAFQTQMHSYQSGAEAHLANATDISIPQAMMGVVRGVSLNNFSFSKPQVKVGPAVRRDASGHWVATTPNFTLGSNFLAPADVAKIYQLNDLYNAGINGAGTTIAIVARGNVSLNDVEVFRQAFNLTANDPNIIVNGQDPGALSLDSIEAALDVQWSGALAPGATIDLVISQSTATTDGVTLSATYIIDNNLADIMSLSFGACEQNIGSDNALYNGLWQQAAAQGISVFVSSGDTGAAGCDPNEPSNQPAAQGLGVNGLASTPFNTSVGGAIFDDAPVSTYWSNTNGPGQVSVLGYIPESVWNESCDPTLNPSCFDYVFDAGGGGVSTVYAKPSWQSTSLTGVPMDGQRDVPDVTLSAAVHDGYLICIVLFAPCLIDSSTNALTNAGVVGGTSASSPSFAAIMALVDQKQGGRQGLANYTLYRLAANENFANCNASARTDPTVPPPANCVFNDITDGNNGVPGNDVTDNPTPGALGYPATPGYDMASGLGSVNAANLVNAWHTATFSGTTTTLVASTPTTIQHGQPVTFGAGVKPLGGSGQPTGTMSLIANPPLAQPNTPPSLSLGIAGGPLANGVFSATVKTLPGGQYNVFARYPGDETFAGSDSNFVAVNVAPEGSGLKFTTTDPFGNSISKAAYGAPVLFHAVVSPASGNGVPTGLVTLSEAGVALAQVPLDSTGIANLSNCILSSPICLNFGQHSLSASYSGDTSLTSSVAGPATFTVIHGTPGMLGLLAQGGELVGFMEVTFFDFGQIPPTGTVTFLNNNVAVSPAVPIPSNLLVFRQLPLTAGSNQITVQYSGDSNYSAGSLIFSPLTLKGDTNPATQTTITPQTNPMVVGQPATFQVNVTVPGSQAVPTGEVEVLVDGQFFPNNSGTVSLVNGSATVQGTMPRAGSILSANFLGDAFGDSNFAPSISSMVPITVTKATPGVTVSSSTTSAPSGSQVTLLVTMTALAGADVPQGTIQFFDALNGAPPAKLGPPVPVLPFVSGATLGGGPANFSNIALPQMLPSGTHVITANYLGDGNYNATPSSNSITVTMGPGFQLAASGGNSATISPGQTAMYNLGLTSAGGFSGSVNLSCFGAPAGMSCAVSPNPVSLTGSTTPVPVTVTITPTGQSRISAPFWRPANLSFALAAVFAIVLFRSRKKPAVRMLVMMLCAFCLVAGITACSGGGANVIARTTPAPTPLPTPSPTPTPITSPTVATIVVTGVSGNATSSVALSLTVNPQ